jgi:ribonuclease T2
MHIAFQLAHRAVATCSAPALVGALALIAIAPAAATVPVTGKFTAERDCAAPVSIKRGTNPGALRVVPGEAYRLKGKNSHDASHYLIELPGAEPLQRWVAIDCGSLSEGSADASSDRAADRAAQKAPERSAAPVSHAAGADSAPDTRRRPASAARPSMPAMQLMLAASWQSAFCEGNAGRPECRRLDADDAAAYRFSLHGLWPQPIGNSYCDVSDRDRRDSRDRDWDDLPRLRLSAETRSRLEALMPGTRSHLHRHEWIKHGSCYGTDAETYYRDSLALMDDLNASPLATLFADNMGRHLSATEIRAAFSDAFGRGAGDRLRIQCRDGLITELRISLKGSPGSDADLADWVRSAPGKSGGCRGGRVDAVGMGRH